MKRSNLGPGIVKRLVSSGRPQGGAAGVLRLEEASRLLVVRQKQEGPFKYSGNEKKYALNSYGLCVIMPIQYSRKLER